MQTVSDVPRKGNVDRNDIAEVKKLMYVDVPRKGNVDRNTATNAKDAVVARTFPARGTWIEMSQWLSTPSRVQGRSPQGERG